MEGELSAAVPMLGLQGGGKGEMLWGHGEGVGSPHPH